MPGNSTAPPERPLLNATLAGAMNGAVPNITMNWFVAGMPGSTSTDLTNLAVTGFSGGLGGGFLAVLTYQRKAREKAALAPAATTKPPLAVRSALFSGLLCGLIGALCTVLVGHTLVGMPDSEMVNIAQHAVGGIVTGAFGGFVGLVMHLRRASVMPRLDAADLQGKESA
ncbi:hypothetical protein [Streptomyces justiciae]|uniref:hypothetical protein n=1 Tax=Streptomyces justiciae TaxID=2780140 RepID=UPI00211993BC|nr:hypothetical protein [Streptomyces justiciae]MCW8378696.1 hypothetical protein [Streptomyces justiciae]